MLYTHLSFFFLMHPPPPRSTLFPYTTLFRSIGNFHRCIKSARPELMTWRGRSFVMENSAAAELVLSKDGGIQRNLDRKSTRLNSSHSSISYAVFCLKKKKEAKFQYVISYLSR